jgi:alpha-galactosidase
LTVVLGGRGRLVVRRPDVTPQVVAVDGPGLVAVAGLEVELAFATGPAPSGGGEVVRLDWSLANPSAAPVALDAVAFEWDEPCGDAVRFFANGYQSWSPTGTRRLGVDEDPSRHPHSIPFVRALHHADPSVAAAGELRSELVTAVDLGRGDGPVCVGFLGGRHHSGTVRARRDTTSTTLTAEAWLGGAVLPTGARRDLHAVTCTRGDDVSTLLEAWAAACGGAEHARTALPYQVGWCSWYYYFHRVTEAAVRENLAHARDWPYTVFQLDDGYQRAIGDWLDTNERFPRGVEGVAADIAHHDLVPGIWLAPFLAHPGSHVATSQPSWFARHARRDEPLPGMYHEDWGGVMWELDTTRDDVVEHLAATARTLVEMGYRYLKLDFTFSPAIAGRYADPTRTPAERVRAGYDAIRAGAGDDTVLLGCGCPLGAVIGVVDAMRIGPDVAPWWEVPPHTGTLPGYEASAPSTRNAWVSTLTRSFMHRRLWVNDPDCLMLRTTDTALSVDAARAWAYAVGVSGGLAIVSDDLARLGPDAHALLDEVLTIGRASDAAAIASHAPRCDDLLDPDGPRTLSGAGWALTADPDDPHARLANTA